MIQRFFITLLLCGSYVLADTGGCIGGNGVDGYYGSKYDQEFCRGADNKVSWKARAYKFYSSAKSNKSCLAVFALGVGFGSLGTLYGESLKGKFLNYQLDNK